MTPDLERYEKKRNFEQTPEPPGESARASRGELEFVVQRHDARRLHYDLRLEHGGVFKSWAVPKEPSLDPHERRLAVQVEDHPLEYGNFEGEIPEDQYGAGSVVIWDRGHWMPLGDPEEGLQQGKLDFELHGERLQGRFTLVRMKERGGKTRRKAKDNWLLMKRTELSEAERAKKTAIADLGAVQGARRAELPGESRPQLATAVTRPPDGADWVHEPKLDGYRLLCRIDGGEASLMTRRGHDWSERFSSVARAAVGLRCRSALLDGEAVIFDQRGRTDFQLLQNAIGVNDPEIVLVAFDLLHLDGWDLRGVPLQGRKELLRALLADAPSAIRYGEHVVARGSDFFKQACKLGLEGIVSKRANDVYREGRTKSWLKTKCQERQEFVIVGYTDPGGSRTGFGALLLGVRDEEGDELRFAGKVGTGFNERSLRDLKTRLLALESKRPTVDIKATRALGRGVHWVKPQLVAEIAYTEWTQDGRLRHPIFKGLREDKLAREVVEEHPVRIKLPQVKLSNPDRILFPDPGITKLELANYWEAVAEVALPFLLNRPLTLLRCPEGYGAACFYQKHVGVGVPKAVPRVIVKTDEDPYAMVDGVGALRGLVQIGVLEMHVWGSRAPKIDQPDILVFDLDPAENVAWKEVAQAALDLRARLEDLGLTAFLRLTGGKGLHLVVPVVPGPEWPAVKKFTRAVVLELVRDSPQRFTASVSKNQRDGKIFVDYLRNDRESTAIASYSPRARPGAPVAMPIEWDELDRRARTPPRFLLRDVASYLARRKRDPWEGFVAARQKLT